MYVDYTVHLTEHIRTSVSCN